MGIQVKSGNNSSGIANVDAGYNLCVVTPTDADDSGFVTIAAEVDHGTVLGTPTRLPLEPSQDYRLRVGTDQTVFNLSFEGTNMATSHMVQGSTTKTLAQSNGYMVLNNGNSGVNSGVATLRSYRFFPLLGTYPLYCDMWLKDVGLAGEIAEFGLFQLASTTSTAAVTDGVFFQRRTGGQLVAMAVFNTSSIIEQTIDETNIPSRDGVGAFNAEETNHYLISFHNDECHFWINDVLVAKMLSPASQATFTQAAAQPVHFRVFNLTGNTVSPRRLEVGFINVSLGDQNIQKPWADAMCGLGGGAYQAQPGNTAGGNVTRTNGAHGWPASATARIAGTWTATTAPGLNSLGGLWVTPAMSTLTSDADYPVFAYLNPVGSTALPGKTLYITGIRVGEAYVAAAASTNAMLLSYIVTVGGTAVATSTGEAVTTASHKATVLGGHGFTATEAIGNYKPGFEITFDSPLVVPQGCYFLFIVRPFGTVTSNTLVVSSSLAVSGYFE